MIGASYTFRCFITVLRWCTAYCVGLLVIFYSAWFNYWCSQRMSSSPVSGFSCFVISQSCYSDSHRWCCGWFYGTGSLFPNLTQAWGCSGWIWCESLCLVCLAYSEEELWVKTSASTVQTKHTPTVLMWSYLSCSLTCVTELYPNMISIFLPKPDLNPWVLTGCVGLSSGSHSLLWWWGPFCAVIRIEVSK